MGAPLPANEGERLDALLGYRILDTASEGEFDHYARLIAQLCGTQIGAVTLIDRDRQWVKAVHGPLARNIPRDHAFCPYTILQTEVLEVPDAQLDPRFAESSLVTGAPHVRFYAGVALVTRTKAALGTLCVLDPQPRHLSPAQRRLLMIAGSHISAQLELRRSLVQLSTEKKLAADCREALTETNRRQQELTAMMVHDFKSPLAAVGLNAELLAGDPSLSPSQQEAADEIVEASDELAGMVNDLLDVSRAEDGQLLIQRSVAVDLATLARESVERSRPVAAAQAQRVEVVTLSASTCVDGDPKILARVVTNLVDNACKYAPSGSRIQLELAAENQRVVLRVIDEGVGIPPSLREAVFEKYFQIDHSDDARASHGLGLAFCRLAIEAHRGTIEVEDRPHGCAFRVSLPRALLDLAPRGENSSG